jgi:hypothetical protein
MEVYRTQNLTKVKFRLVLKVKFVSIEVITSMVGNYSHESMKIRHTLGNYFVDKYKDDCGSSKGKVEHGDQDEIE